MLGKKELIEFCTSRGIFVPPKATLAYLQRAVVRAALHNTEVNGKDCFGLWQFEDSNCISCDFSEKCFTASIGMEKEEFFKSLSKMENPRLRFKDSLK